ncbi:hypothetical protein MRR68_22715, partial [Aeromonas dhakensis]|nr:hypothetical protein [Aeromonas dhakensis]
RDPDQNVRTQLAGVDEEIGKLDAALKAQTVDLIQAHEMPEVLVDIEIAALQLEADAVLEQVDALLARHQRLGRQRSERHHVQI